MNSVFSSLLQLLMAILYLGVGFLLWFAEDFQIYNPWNRILSTILICYGLWRGLRSFKKPVQENENPEE